MPIAEGTGRMVERLKRLAHDADAWLIHHRWTRIGRRAIGGFLQHNALQNAGSMAYFSILSIFQLLVLGVVVVSFFMGEGQARQFVIDQVEAGTPLDPETIVAVIDGVIESRGGIGLASFAILVGGALGAFSALNRGISSAFVATEPRGFLRDKLTGLALMAITGVLGVASIAIGIVTDLLQEATADVLDAVPGGSLALGLVGFIVPILLIFAAFMAVYRLVPNRPITLREVWPGALVATALWTVLRVGFTYYATDVARYDTAFGPIAAAISLLVFLYFASVVVLLGAQFARANVLDDPANLPRPILADAFAPRPRPGSDASSSVDRAQDRSRRPPRWAMALGGAAAAATVRWLARRGRRG